MTAITCFTSAEKVHNSTDLQVLEAANRLAILLRQMGYPVQAYSETARNKLLVTSETKKYEMISCFNNWSQWIEPLDPTKSYDNELHLLVKSLEKHGFQLNLDFIKTIEKDQIVEFYTEDMIQLYRSFNFYKITGYSLLDISLHEWYVLWERPRQVLESLAGELAETLQTHIPVKEFNTRKHIVREILNTSKSEEFKPRASLLTPIRLGSLNPSQFSPSQKKGFICTSRGEVLAIGKEVANFEFI
jgi:hypothetical protein